MTRKSKVSHGQVRSDLGMSKLPGVMSFVMCLIPHLDLSQDAQSYLSNAPCHRLGFVGMPGLATVVSVRRGLPIHMPSFMMSHNNTQHTYSFDYMPVSGPNRSLHTLDVKSMPGILYISAV